MKSKEKGYRTLVAEEANRLVERLAAGEAFQNP
jgi:hypothetical protein